MRFITGNCENLTSELYFRVAHYRHQVFVEKLGWSLVSQNGKEADQFDRADTVYVVAQDQDDQISGCARLLPTDKPYLLGEVFPQLLPQGFALPCSSEIWELSRFAAVDLSHQNAVDEGQFSSSIAIGLLQAAIECAAKRGAKRLITVSPVGVERLLRKAGFYAHRAGPPMIINGYPLFACWIDIDKNIKD